MLHVQWFHVPWTKLRVLRLPGNSSLRAGIIQTVYQGKIKCSISYFSWIIFTSLKCCPETETVIAQLQFLVPLCQSKNWEIQDANRLQQLFQQQEVLLCGTHCLKVHILFKTWPCLHSESMKIFYLKAEIRPSCWTLKHMRDQSTIPSPLPSNVNKVRQNHKWPITHLPEQINYPLA